MISHFRAPRPSETATDYEGSKTFKSIKPAQAVFPPPPRLTRLGVRVPLLLVAKDKSTFPRRVRLNIA